MKNIFKRTIAILSFIVGGFMLCVFILLGMFLNSDELKDVLNPRPIEADLAVHAMIKNTLHVGNRYLMDRGGGVIVAQNLNSGLLLRNKYASAWGLPDIFYVKTPDRYADGTSIGSLNCLVYEGLYTYNTVNGSTNTVHGFRKLDCSLYDKSTLMEIVK